MALATLDRLWMTTSSGELVPKHDPPQSLRHSVIARALGIDRLRGTASSGSEGLSGLPEVLHVIGG